MADKPFVQKGYEKLEMVKRNPKMMTVMIAKDQDGTPSLVLMAGSRPVARILSHRETQTLSPQFEASKILLDLFDRAAKSETRKSLSDFDKEDAEITKLFNDMVDEFDRLGF